MSRETIDEKRREQKIHRELVNLSEEESTQDLYEEMDNLSEDLKHDEESGFSRESEYIENESNDDASVCPEELPMNTESEELEYYHVTQESDIETRNDEKSEPPAQMESLEKSGNCGEEQSEKGTVAKYWLLFAGIILVGIGMFGVTGLRLNIVQTYLLAIDNPFPGIGSVEPIGHIVSIIPFAIGIVAILVWGFLSNNGEESEEELDEEESEVIREEFAKVEAEPQEFEFEEDNTPNAKSMGSKGHAGAVISSIMGIIFLFVWGLLPEKAEVAGESDSEDD